MDTLKLIQDTPEWFQFRKEHIGASDSPIILKVCKFKTNDGRKKTPYLLWQEKLGLRAISCNNSATRYGKTMEEPARKEYERIKGDLFTPTVLVHSEYKYISASLDGLNFTEDRAVEIKNANKEDHELAKQGKVPDHYYPQLQHQLECTGHSEMDYFSYHKGEGIIVVVKRDEEYIEKLLKKLEEFWTYVVNLKEPPLTEDDYIERDEEWEKTADVLYQTKQNVKELEKTIKLLEDKLKELSEGQNSRFGGYSYGSTTGPGRINYKVIPELSGVDLESYRGSPIKSWRLKKEK
jgi:putative phage-type endonuclease